MLFLVVLLTAIWGTNWVLLPLAIREVSIWTFRAICLLGAGSIILLFAFLRGIPLRVPAEERKSLLAASLTYLITWNVAATYAATIVPMALGNVAWFSIVNSLPTALSGISTVMVPIDAMITGAVVRGEPLGFLEIGAMGCCACAMALALLRRQSSR